MSDFSYGDAILTAAEQHYEHLRRQSCVIPELRDPETGEPLEIFYDPPSMATRAKIDKLSMGSDARRAIFVLIHCARDKAGKPIWKDDAKTLGRFETGVMPSWISRTALIILNQVTEPSDLGN